MHDLGGRQGFGRVETEPDEPPFHEPWEGRVHGMSETADVGPGFRGVRAYRFEGGCIVYRFDIDARRAGVLVDEGSLAVGFLSRAEVKTRIQAAGRPAGVLIKSDDALSARLRIQRDF